MLDPHLRLSYDKKTAVYAGRNLKAVPFRGCSRCAIFDLCPSCGPYTHCCLSEHTRKDRTPSMWVLSTDIV